MKAIDTPQKRQNRKQKTKGKVGVIGERTGAGMGIDKTKEREGDVPLLFVRLKMASLVLNLLTKRF